MAFTDPVKATAWFNVTIYGNDINMGAQPWTQNQGGEYHLETQLQRLADLLNNSGWGMDVVKCTQMDQMYPDPNK